MIRSNTIGALSRVRAMIANLDFDSITSIPPEEIDAACQAIQEAEELIAADGEELHQLRRREKERRIVPATAKPERIDGVRRALANFDRRIRGG